MGFLHSCIFSYYYFTTYKNNSLSWSKQELCTFLKVQIEFEHAVWQQLRQKRKANFTSWCILIHFYKKALFICWMYNVHVSHKQFFRTHMNVPVLKKLSVFFMFSWSTSKTTCSQRPEWPGSLQWPVRTGWLAATDSPALSVYNPRTWLHVSQKYT